MTKQLLLGTGNPGKILEISQALGSLRFRIVTPAELGITDVPKEEGETFLDNALEKARFYFERSKHIPTLADDSGIEVEALQNELGIHTRRWGAGPGASDAHWLQFFLKRMRGETNKKARFFCVLCHIDATGAEQFFEGSCGGIITDELEADYLPGLPISACFRPDGFDRVYSALSVEEKTRISHRGRAIKAFREFLV